MNAFITYNNTILKSFRSKGKGTVLAAANYFKLNAIGVELASKRCKQSSKLDLTDAINDITK